MLTNLVATAVSSAMGKWAKKQPSIPVGDHVIDHTITVRVKGLIKKLEEEEFTPTIKIPQLAVLAFLLPSLGATREIQKDKLLSACRKALSLGGKIEDSLKELMKDVEEAFKLVEEGVTSQLPKEIREGKTIVKCEVEEVVGLRAEVISEVFSTGEKTVSEMV
jgi:hypothetical protein